MISVIVPIYNVEKYLPKCLESLVNQTYRDIEIILVDDGSPDRCPEICDAYAQKDRRIVVIHQKNGGVSSARNAGLRAARGAFIGFVDPDDWVQLKMYEVMLEAMNERQADMVVCGYEYYDEDGNLDEVRRYPCREDEIISQKEMMKRFSDIPPTVRHVVWNKLFKRALLNDLYFKEGLHASEDVLFLMDYVLKIKSAAVVHRPLYCNRMRDGSATRGGLDVKSLSASFEAHDYMYQSIVRAYPELRSYSQAFLLDVCLLKYHEAKRKCGSTKGGRAYDLSALSRMRRYIRRQGRRAVMNPHIYWKTRIAYLIVR